MSGESLEWEGRVKEAAAAAAGQKEKEGEEVLGGLPFPPWRPAGRKGSM